MLKDEEESQPSDSVFVSIATHFVFIHSSRFVQILDSSRFIGYLKGVAGNFQFRK